MRILLLYPNARHGELIGYGDLGAVAEPLALEYLAAGARLDDHEVRILDLRLHPNRLANELLAFEPQVVGVTGYSMHVLTALRLCSIAKTARPDCVTVVGGHHATLMPEDFFEPQVDHVVCGEGTVPFRRLLRGIEQGVAPRLPGVWSRDGDVFRDGGPAASFSIDDLPAPDRLLVPRDRESYFIDWMRPIALVRTTVGCPYRCNFCSLWRIMDGRYHVRDVERVAAEIAAVREQSIFLVDDEAFVNGPRMAALAQELQRAGVRKRFFAYCRMDTLLRQRPLMEQWRATGLERLFIGIEAPTQKGLNDYNKKIGLAQVENGLRAAREIGIQVFAGFVVNPNYTLRDFKILRRFVEHQRIDYPSFTILTPLPGTDSLKSFAAITELQPNGRPNWDLFDLQHAVIPTVLPREVFMEQYRELYHLFSAKYSVHRETLRLRDASGAVVA